MHRIRISLLILLLSSSAFAAPSSTPNPNSLPVYVTSDSATADLNAGTLTYDGNFVATQGTRKLTGNTLTVIRGKNNQIQSFVAQGSPAVSQEKPSPTAALATGQAETIYYFPGQNLVKYVKDAKFTQGGNVFTGDMITYNTETQVVSAPKTAAGTRTSTIILPPYNSQKESAGS